MQNFKDLYTELATKINTQIPEFKWIDLWHNQVNFLETEHPFPTPAIFMNFRILQATDNGLKVQNVKMQLDTYIFYETFADTYHASFNQQSAFAFLDLISRTHAVLHGSEGENYSSMRRIGMSAVDTGSAGNLYLLNFECYLQDYGAQKLYENATSEDFIIDPGVAPEPEPEVPAQEALFRVHF